MKNILINSLFLLFNLYLSAQEIKHEALNKKIKLGVVLSGGGAKGMAHIGVLKVLEEHNLYPDYITGVSMGSIVGALYSLGYSPNQMKDIVTDIDWDELLSDKIPLRDISIFEKEDYPGYPLKINFNKRLRLSLPSGMIEAQKVEQLFSKLVWKSNLYENFDSLPIPYRSVAVDILTGKPFVFKKGNLAQAMRSSMAIPSVFTPVEKEGMILVDGGVTITYPAQACLDMGADVLIGSYTGIKEKPDKSELNSMLRVLTRSSVVSSLVDTEKQKKKTTVFIAPNLNGINVADFSKACEIVKRGETAARDSLVDSKLTLLKKKFTKTMRKSTYYKDSTKLWVDHIFVKGCKLTDSLTIKKISKLKSKSYFTAEEVNEAITNIYARWQFKKVGYHFKKTENSSNLIIDIKEKSRGLSSLGVHYDNTNGPSLLLKSTYKNLFFKSTLGKLKLAVSENPRMQFNYKYYPAGSRMIEASLNTNYLLSNIPDIIKNEGEDYRLGHYVHSHLDINTALSLAPYRNLLLQASVGKQLNNILLKDGMQFYYNANFINYNLDYVKFRLNLNTFNDNYFPTKGVFINTSYKATFNVKSTKGNTTEFIDYIEGENSIFNFQYKQFLYLFNHLSIVPRINFGIMETPEFITEKFFIGGMNYSLNPNTFNFSGMRSNYITSNGFLMYGIGGQYRMFKDWFLNAGVDQLYFMNYVNYENEDEIEIDDVTTSWNIGLGTHTKIGPIRLIVSQNIDKPGQLYWSINLGFPF